MEQNKKIWCAPNLQWKAPYHTRNLMIKEQKSEEKIRTRYWESIPKGKA